MSWVFYMSIHFSVSNSILILPLRKLRLGYWPIVTLLEIAQPGLNPGLLNSKAWVLVHITGRRNFATTGWSLRDQLIQQGKPSVPLHLLTTLPNTHICICAFLIPDRLCLHLGIFSWSSVSLGSARTVVKLISGQA